jgi:2-polyprenyl-6-methoxyphenol hydroxylase-like FAD-dependent oxidoreductase
VMLGLLLGRAGVPVVVLEKHADFLRDFRGDTVHPSTLELMHELGLLEDFLRRPHQKVHELGGQIFGEQLRFADFSHLPTRARFIAMMPLWDFLDFLTGHARRSPSFELRVQAAATELLWEGDRVAGVRVETPEGPLEVHADLTVGADGRTSIVREQAGPTLTGSTSAVPRLARLLDDWALLRRIPARLIGLGVRPEHVSPELRVPPHS